MHVLFDNWNAWQDTTAAHSVAVSNQLKVILHHLDWVGCIAPLVSMRTA